MAVSVSVTDLSSAMWLLLFHIFRLDRLKWCEFLHDAHRIV